MRMSYQNCWSPADVKLLFLWQIPVHSLDWAQVMFQVLMILGHKYEFSGIYSSTVLIYQILLYPSEWSGDYWVTACPAATLSRDSFSLAVNLDSVSYGKLRTIWRRHFVLDIDEFPSRGATLLSRAQASHRLLDGNSKMRLYKRFLTGQGVIKFCLRQVWKSWCLVKTPSWLLLFTRLNFYIKYKDNVNPIIPLRTS